MQHFIRMEKMRLTKEDKIETLNNQIDKLEEEIFIIFVQNASINSLEWDFKNQKLVQKEIVKLSYLVSILTNELKRLEEEKDVRNY